MQKSSKYFLVTILFLTATLSLQTLYMYSNSKLHVKSKNEFVKAVGLPDLALSNGANFIRHRSLADTFSLFSNGAELLEYFPSTFVYNHTQNHKKNYARIKIEK